MNLLKIVVDAFQSEGLVLSSRNLITLAACSRYEPSIFGENVHQALDLWPNDEQRLAILQVLRATLEMQPTTHRGLSMSFSVAYGRVRHVEFSESLLTTARLGIQCGLLSPEIGQEALDILGDLWFEQDLKDILGENHQLYMEMIQLRQEVDTKVDLILKRIQQPNH